MSECWVRGWTHVSSRYISPVCLVHSCRPSRTGFLPHTKPYISEKGIFSKQGSVGGQRRHYLGPWEVWVCLWGCNLLFFLVFISESWRISTGYRWRQHLASGGWCGSLSVHSWFDLRDLSFQELWMSVAGEWEMLRLDASENFHWTLLGLPKQVKSPCPTEQSRLI